MTAAEQHKEFGACVEAQDDIVILQVGTEMVALSVDQAQRFAYYLARAYYRAGIIERAGVEPLGPPQSAEDVTERVS